MDAPHPTLRRFAWACAAVGVVAAVAAPAASASDWIIRQKVTNKTPYELRLTSMTTTELTSNPDKPAAKIAPGASDRLTVVNGAPGHGVAVVASYDLFDTRKSPDLYKGTVLVRSGVDCQWRVTVKSLPACLDYSRYNRADVDSGGAVNVRWWNNGGDPKNGFETEVEVTTPSASGSSGAEKDPGDPLPDDAEEQPNGLNWNAVHGIVNNTDYVLRKRAQWTSEETHFDPQAPDTIAPHTTGHGNVGNSTFLHGPQVVYLYDLLDPETKAFRSSVVAIAGVNCTTYLPRVGCVAHSDMAQAIGDGAKRVTTRVDSFSDQSPANFRTVLTFNQTKLGTGPLAADDDDDRDSRVMR